MRHAKLNRVLNQLLLAALLLASGAVFVYAGDDIPDPSKKVQDVVTEKDVTMSVSIPVRLIAGDGVPLAVKLTNKRNGAITLSYSSVDLPLLFKINLVDDKGKVVPFTRFGKKLLAPTELEDQIARSRESFRSLLIKSNGSRDISLKNLGLIYDLTVPGEYILTVSKVVVLGELEGESLPLKAKPLRFAVVAP